MSRPPQSRAGLTLLELLAAIALLSAVVSAAGAWCTALARMEANVRAGARATPLERTLEAIDGDIRSAPKLPSREATVVFDSERREVRIARFDPENAAAPLDWIVWRFDHERSTIVRETRGASGLEEARIALRGATNFVVEPIVEPASLPGAAARVLGRRVVLEMREALASRAWEEVR